MKQVLHGLLQKCLLDANALHSSYRINPNGDLWRYSPLGWIKSGEIHNERDQEDFLVSKLTQEDR